MTTFVWERSGICSRMLLTCRNKSASHESTSRFCRQNLNRKKGCSIRRGLLGARGLERLECLPDSLAEMISSINAYLATNIGKIVYDSIGRGQVK